MKKRLFSIILIVTLTILSFTVAFAYDRTINVGANNYNDTYVKNLTSLKSYTWNMGGNNYIRSQFTHIGGSGSNCMRARVTQYYKTTDIIYNTAYNDGILSVDDYVVASLVRNFSSSLYNVHSGTIYGVSNWNYAYESTIAESISVRANQ